MNKEETFNKIFNWFILIGMTVAMVLTTVLKLSAAESGKWLLIISAFGSLMGVLSTICSANGWVITFLFGLLDVSIYGAMCLHNWYSGNSGLGNAILHFIYFVPMEFVGFAQWRKRGAGSESTVKARRLSTKQWILITVALIVSSVVLYLILARFDKSSADGFIRTAVILDILPLVCNVVGQMLMSTAFLEQWYFWIGVNIFSIIMWTRTLQNGGDSYALIYIIKYGFYLINSFNGLRIWYGLSRSRQ